MTYPKHGYRLTENEKDVKKMTISGAMRREGVKNAVDLYLPGKSPLVVTQDCVSEPDRNQNQANGAFSWLIKKEVFFKTDEGTFASLEACQWYDEQVKNGK